MAGMLCKSCDALVINGILCHEQGCPDAWKDYTKECKWCGCEFKPTDKYQVYCDSTCANCDNGVMTDEDELLEERYGD